MWNELYLSLDPYVDNRNTAYYLHPNLYDIRYNSKVVKNMRQRSITFIWLVAQ